MVCGMDGEAWADVLKEREDDDIVFKLRASTHTGRPLGRDSFLSKLEHTLGRRLRPLPVGRPMKKKMIERRSRKK